MGEITVETEHFRRLERMYLKAPANEYYRPNLSVDAGRAEVRIAVRADFMIPAGSVHGSVYFKALDDAAYFACSSLETEWFMLTSSFTMHLFRPVHAGVLVASGEVVHRSRRQFVAEAVLRDGDGVQLARGSGTFMTGRTELGAELGYA